MPFDTDVCQVLGLTVSARLNGVRPRFVWIFTIPEPRSPYSAEGTPEITSTDSTLSTATLRMFDFVGADNCREILLSGCSSLTKIKLYRTNTRLFVVQPAGFISPSRIDVFGNGVLQEVIYGNPRLVDVENNEFRVQAETFSGSFLGWYADGELYSSNNFCRISDFERLTACFGGDTDGDGNISVADAVLIARSAIGVNSLSCDFNMADIDADGSISISDATSVMRFAMQVR